MCNILLCSLGASWAVIPEVYAFLAPEILPLYQQHPEREQLLALRAQYDLHAPDEIWVCTTLGEQTQKSLDALLQWHKLLRAPLILRIFQAENTNQLASQLECKAMRELILRACLAAHHHAQNGQVVLSLAGGRKTMSADMQWAGSLFGCQALIHVVGTEPLPEALRKASPEFFTRAIAAELCSAILTLVTGATQRNDILDVQLNNQPSIQSQHFSLPLPPANQKLQWLAENHDLQTEIKHREQAGSQLLGNYLISLSQQDHHENWRSLYRLPPRVIGRLKQTPVTANARSWLQQLPKADLHRHVGGCLDINGQRAVGQAVWHALNFKEQQGALKRVAALLSDKEWPWDWPITLKHAGERSHAVAALLQYASDEQLQQNLYRSTSPRVALKQRHAHGFQAYERPGELTGSAILSHPAAWDAYAAQLVQQAYTEGLAYIELRGSPQKYAQGLDFLKQFASALKHYCARLTCPIIPQFRFIIIADRRNPELLENTIKLALAAKDCLPDFIVGMDLAGDERNSQPKQLASAFLSLFEHCLPLTIHAGEGETAAAIWEAAYYLHADRIGHGLSINEHPLLAERFRNRDICLELCPTSNREVVGFFDPAIPETENLPEYPLMALWQLGLPLTLCTDNPGISQTSLTEEYLTAARMSQGQLSYWDTLAMIKQAYVHAFLPAHEKETLVKQIDAAIFQQLTQSEYSKQPLIHYA